MLITKPEIIVLAYLVPVEENMIKDSIIAAAVEKYIRPVLTHELYEDICLYPAHYPYLHAMIKPCLAYFVRFLSYNQQGEQYHQQTADEIFFIAVEHLRALSNFIEKQKYPLYSPASRKSIAGILVNRPTVSHVNGITDQDEQYIADENNQIITT